VKSLLVLTLALAAALASAEPYAVDGTLRPFALEDQHGVRAEVGEGVQIILLTRDMDGGNLAKTALEDVPQSILDQRRAVYIADTSAMPALIARFTALPRMRKRPYRVLVDRDGKATRDLPYTKGTVTLIALDGLRIKRVEELTSVEGVRAELGLPPGSEPSR
jgi:hypothetical protein